MSQIKPKARQTEIVVQELGDELLIYNLKTNKTFALNETAALVWRNCDGKNSIAEIAGKLTLELKEFVSEDMIWLALEKLKKDDLIETDKNFVLPFGNSSRREVIRRVGMASLVALPVIASLVAPTSVYAGSCNDPDNNLSLNANGCACVSNNDCASICCGIAGCTESMSVAPGGACIRPCECAMDCRLDLGGICE